MEIAPIIILVTILAIVIVNGILVAMTTNAGLIASTPIATLRTMGAISSITTMIGLALMLLLFFIGAIQMASTVSSTVKDIPFEELTASLSRLS